MKLLKTCVSLLFMGFISLSTIAQKIKLIEGDLSLFKTETSINVQFTYDNMSVGKFDKESDYVTKKTDEYNKKEPGRGDAWAKNWVNNRSGMYEPKFIELFEKESGMTIAQKPAKYTLVFKTLFTEPGYNIPMISHENANINAEAWIIETDSKKVIAKISIIKAPGRSYGGSDYDTGVRVAESYADAGKYLAKFIKKN